MCSAPKAPKPIAPPPPLDLATLNPGGEAKEGQIKRRKLGKRRLQVSLGGAGGQGSGIGIPKK
jgi:hypothetical protein